MTLQTRQIFRQSLGSQITTQIAGPEINVTFPKRCEVRRGRGNLDPKLGTATAIETVAKSLPSQPGRLAEFSQGPKQGFVTSAES